VAALSSRRFDLAFGVRSTIAEPFDFRSLPKFGCWIKSRHKAKISQTFA
jgi:hypothetical protein